MKLIFGPRGRGKDLLCTYFAIQKMFNGLEESYQSQEIVKKYNSMGFNFSTNYEHLLFANYDINCLGTFCPNRRSYVFNPYRIGLYDPNYSTDILPPLTLAIITEAQRVFNSYVAKKFRDSFFAYFETSRHWGVDFILNCQRPILIAPNVRELVDEFMYIEKLEHKYDLKGNCIGHTWTIIEWYEWQSCANFLKNGKLENYRKYKIHCDKCLFENYDSYFLRYIHLRGREKQDFKIEHFPTINSIKDIEKFGDIFGLTMPKGFLKSKETEYSEEDSYYYENILEVS